MQAHKFNQWYFRMLADYIALGHAMLDKTPKPLKEFLNYKRSPTAQLMLDTFEAAKRAVTGRPSLRAEIAELRENVAEDPLTGVASRRFIDKLLNTLHLQVTQDVKPPNQEGSRFSLTGNRRTNQEKPTSYGIILVDIDFFKKINDNYDHATGDRVLKSVGATLLKCINDHCRPGDQVGRWGGEEFMLVLPGCKDLNRIASIADQIRKKIEETSIRISRDESINITASLGATLYTCDPNHKPQAPTKTAEDVFKLADSALYAAKNAGRNRVYLAEDGNIMACDSKEKPRLAATGPKVIKTNAPSP